MRDGGLRRTGATALALTALAMLAVVAAASVDRAVAVGVLPEASPVTEGLDAQAAFAAVAVLLPAFLLSAGALLLLRTTARAAGLPGSCPVAVTALGGVAFLVAFGGRPLDALNAHPLADVAAKVGPVLQGERSPLDVLVLAAPVAMAAALAALAGRRLDVRHPWRIGRPTGASRRHPSLPRSWRPRFLSRRVSERRFLARTVVGRCPRRSSGHSSRPGARTVAVMSPPGMAQACLLPSDASPFCGAAR